MTATKTFLALAIPLAMLASGCEHDHPFHESMKLGGLTYTADQLNHGRDQYMQYCRPCHGENGDGRGYSSKGLRPPPRDFTVGMFKFGAVPAPALPPDSELVRIVRGGLHGTAMLPWDLPDAELMDVLGFVKTFSPKWQTEEVGKPVERSPDMYGEAKKAEAVALGEKLYHAKAQCSGCHPAFVSHEKMFQLTKEVSGTGQAEFSAEMYLSQIKETEYCLDWKPRSCQTAPVKELPATFKREVRGGHALADAEYCVKWGTPAEEPGEHHRAVPREPECEAYCTQLADRECAKPVKLLPPNFTKDPLRSIRPAGTPEEIRGDLYRLIASGIGGANMPTWKGALKEEEIWGMVYYVQSLMELRNTPAAIDLSNRLNAQANLAWVPPAAAPEAPAPAPDTKKAPAPKKM